MLGQRGHLRDQGSLGDFGAALAQLGLQAKLGVHFAQLINQLFGFELFRFQQPGEFGLFLGQRGMFAADFHFLQLAQGPQAHVEDGVGLVLVQLERLHQHGARFVLGADDLDDLVQVEEGGQIAFQHFHAAGDLFQPVGAAALQHFAAMGGKGGQDFLQAHHARDKALVQHVHVQRNARFQVGRAEQLFHQDLWLDRAGLGRQHDADVFGAFVLDIVQQRQLLLFQEFGNALDQLGLADLVGDFGDDDLPGAARALFPFPAGADAKAAAAGLVGFGHAGLVFDDDAAGGKVGALDELQQRTVLDVRVLDQRDGGGDKLTQIVRRDGGGHAHGDAVAAVCQQVREGRRQHHGLAGFAVIGGAKINRVFVQAVQQRGGDLGQAAFGVAHGGGVIAVHVAEVALPVDQRIADGEFLGQAHQRVIDRLVAVRMERAHHVAHHLGGFLEGAVGVQPQQAHAVEDAAMHRLQPVAHIGQRALGDGGERIGQIALGQRLAQGFGTDFFG